MAVSISISVTQNSQNIVNNTSNVTVKVNCSWTNGSWNAIVNDDGQPKANGSLKIDGTSYPFRSTFNVKHTMSGSQTLFTKTLDIKHDDDGVKTLACSASFTTYVSSGTVKTSASKTLKTIPRKSELKVSNGVLNTGQTITVVQKSTNFTHTVKASCGTTTDSVTICSKSKNTSLAFTPPLKWAKYNTTGTTVTVNITITTYNGTSDLGSNTYAIVCTIPASVKPSCSIEVSDPNGWADSYGDYIKGQSKFYIKIASTLAHESPIDTYKITADGDTYSKSSVTTGFIKNVGQQTITAEVKDKRGRTGTASITVNVLDYSLPVISSLTVHRCNEDGTLNDQGDWVQVSFNATLVNPKGSNGYENECGYTIETKRSSDEQYESNEITSLNNTFEVTGATYLFAADSSSSYDIRLTAHDRFGSYTKATSVSTGYTIMHWKANGRGMAIGKVSELDDIFDIGMQIRLLGGLLYPVIEPETDLNDLKTPGFYIGENVSTYNYTNCPVTAGTFTFEVLSAGVNGQVLQRLTRCDKLKPLVFQRYWYGGSWGEWFWAGSDEVLLYENSAGSNETITMRLNNDPDNDVVSAGHFRYLEIYFTDNNGKGGGYTKIWNPNGKTISLQITEPSTSIYSRQTFYAISGSTVTPDIDTASYYRITSAGAVNTSIGTNYIKIVRIVGRP